MPLNPLKRKRDPVLEPCISELLRTCVHPDSISLRVQRVVREKIAPEVEDCGPTAQDDDEHSTKTTRYATRFFLTDGSLTIQALLSKSLLSRDVQYEIGEGDLLDIGPFEVKKAKRSNGTGHVVYLCVERCQVVSSKPNRILMNMEVGVNHDDENVKDKESRIGNSRAKRFRAEVERFDSSVQKGGIDHAEGFIAEVPAQRKPSSEYNPHSVTFQRIDQSDLGDEKVSLPVSYQEVRSESEQENTSFTSEINPAREAQPFAIERMNKQYMMNDQQPAGDDITTVAANKMDLDHQPANLSRRGELKPAVDIPSSQDTDTDDFETIHVHHTTISSRRQALRNLKHNISQHTAPPKLEHTAADSHRPHLIHDPARPPTITTPPTTTTTTSLHPHRAPLSIPTTLSSPQLPITTPPTLTPLSHLLSSSIPLPRQFSLLCIVSWISTSLINRPGPFPPKRHLKLHDLSITHRYAGVTLAVFVDAASFRPAVGTVALIRGVGCTRLPSRRDGKGNKQAKEKEVEAILNAYPSLKERERVEGMKWWVDDQKELEEMGLGEEAGGLKAWWAERHKSKVGDSGMT